MLLTLSTGLFGNRRLIDLIPLIREAGFRRLELVDTREFSEDALDDLLLKATEYDIEIPNWHLIQESPFDASGQIDRNSVANMERSMELGYRVGAKSQVLHWYHRFVDRRYDRLWQKVVEEWTAFAADLGVKLLMETVPDKPSNERYVPASEIIDFVNAYPSQSLSICVDINHSNLQENLSDVVRGVGDRLASLHISDNDGKSERHWLPGQGVIDYRSLLDTLVRVQFAGTFVLEIGPWCREPHALPELRRLYEYTTYLLTEKYPHPDTPDRYQGPE